MLQIFQEAVQLFSVPPCHKHLLYYKSCSHSQLRESNASALQRGKNLYPFTTLSPLTPQPRHFQVQKNKKTVLMCSDQETDLQMYFNTSS